MSSFVLRNQIVSKFRPRTVVDSSHVALCPVCSRLFLACPAVRPFSPPDFHVVFFFPFKNCGLFPTLNAYRALNQMYNLACADASTPCRALCRLLHAFACDAARTFLLLSTPTHPHLVPSSPCRASLGDSLGRDMSRVECLAFCLFVRLLCGPLSPARIARLLRSHVPLAVWVGALLESKGVLTTIHPVSPNRRARGERGRREEIYLLLAC